MEKTTQIHQIAVRTWLWAAIFTAGLFASFHNNYGAAIFACISVVLAFLAP